MIEKKVYLETDEEARLKVKAKEVGIEGRAWLSNYLRKIARSDIAIIDNNIKKVMSLFRLEEKTT